MPDIRGFYIHSESYYAKSACLRDNLEEEIMFGMYDDNDQGCAYELTARWHSLSHGPSIRIDVFYDAFKAFYDFKALFEDLADRHDDMLTKDEFVELLKKHGFKDLTKRERK